MFHKNEYVLRGLLTMEIEEVKKTVRLNKCCIIGDLRSAKLRKLQSPYPLFTSPFSQNVCNGYIVQDVSLDEFEVVIRLQKERKK